MPVVNGDGAVILALVRGDDRLDEAKAEAAIGTAVRPATEDEIRAFFNADPGSIGPVGFEGEIVWDTAKPDGMPRKCMDVSRMRELGFVPQITLEQGIERTIAEYREIVSRNEGEGSR